MIGTTDPEPSGRSLPEASETVREVGKGPNGLRPFVPGDPRAIEAGRKGGRSRRLQRDAKVGDVRALRTLTEQARATFDRADLGDTAAAVAAWLMGQLMAGAIRLRGADVAPTLRALVDIARLEAGEATSAALVAHVDAATVAARVDLLQQQARAALGMVSLAAQATGDAGADVDAGADGSRGATDGVPEG